MRDIQELFVGAFSFGGGTGGKCFDEPAANLKTLREAKRDDDEEDCFWPDPGLLVVAIVVLLRVGRVGYPDRGWFSGGRVLYGRDLVPFDRNSLRFRIRQVSIWLCLATWLVFSRWTF